MRTLVTFLGRGQHDPQTGYRSAVYRFPSGWRRETPFFGVALAEHLAPDRVVVLGTAGSMWDVLIEHLADTEAAPYEDQRLRLLEAAQEQNVDEEHLEVLRPLAEEAFGTRCELVLIPYAETLGPQIELLDSLHGAVAHDEEVHFDITHGLRHLAMLTLVAGHYLEAMSRTLSVEQIWYGALELRGQDGDVPVVQLEGLRRLQRWSQVLEHFEREGDYAPFADLLEAEGVDPGQADLLRQAAFFERVLNLPEARRKLRTFLDQLEEPLPGVARLFGPRLKERIRWVRSASLFQHQLQLARTYLHQEDYLRAAILANEMVLTRWMEERGEGDRNSYRDRQAARGAMLDEVHQAPRDAWTNDFRRLEHIRNALAHGTVPERRELRQLLSHRHRLHRELERLINELAAIG